jgi:hypothetical protein
MRPRIVIPARTPRLYRQNRYECFNANKRCFRKAPNLPQIRQRRRWKDVPRAAYLTWPLLLQRPR